MGNARGTMSYYNFVTLNLIEGRCKKLKNYEHQISGNGTVMCANKSYRRAKATQAI